MSSVVFIHPDVAADLVARAQAGEVVECEVRDGELVRLCGVTVRVCDTIGRLPSLEIPRLAASTLLRVPEHRGAQWKRERQGWARRR